MFGHKQMQQTNEMNSGMNNNRGTQQQYLHIQQQDAPELFADSALSMIRPHASIDRDTGGTLTKLYNY